jgi:hypothetical protein
MRTSLAAIPFLLAGCASLGSEPFQLSAPAQHLIGRPEAQVLGCLGPPKQKEEVEAATVALPSSGKSIWTYEYAEGPQTCSLRLVFKGGYVSQVTSMDASGATLPRDVCLPTNLAWCANTAPPPPPPTAAKSKPW